MFWIRVRTAGHDDCAVVELHGELDISTTLTARGLLITVAAREKVTIVDLAGLDFMDCTGMGALIRARKHSLRAGHALHLAAPARPVLQVLELTGVARLFSIHASVEAATAAASGRSSRAPAAHHSVRRRPQWRPFRRLCARAFALSGATMIFRQRRSLS